MALITFEDLLVVSFLVTRSRVSDFGFKKAPSVCSSSSGSDSFEHIRVKELPENLLEKSQHVSSMQGLEPDDENLAVSDKTVAHEDVSKNLAKEEPKITTTDEKAIDDNETLPADVLKDLEKEKIKVVLPDAITIDKVENDTEFFSNITGIFKKVTNLSSSSSDSCSSSDGADTRERSDPQKAVLYLDTLERSDHEYENGTLFEGIKTVGTEPCDKILTDDDLKSNEKELLSIQKKVHEDEEIPCSKDGDQIRDANIPQTISNEREIPI